MRETTQPAVYLRQVQVSYNSCPGGSLKAKFISTCAFAKF